MNDTMFWVIWIVAGIICGAVGAWAGETKGRAAAGFWLGFFFGPLGWITVLLMDRPEPLPPPVQPQPEPGGPVDTRSPQQILADIDADLRAAREATERR